MDLPFPAPPAEATRRNVFVINDIDLVIPPSQIDVSQEDLLYNWKTLRSNASTKIATGHGQIRVHVSMQFTNAMILDLHRLIVQFRHSPFCSIKNSYLRESVVPDWPQYQQMAFTMTSMHVSPVPGLSDTWNVEMDLLWFNYFPYLHNYLYREDWHTNWIDLDTALEQDDRVKLSIGWDLDPITGERKRRLSTVATEANSDAEGISHPAWSTLEDAYNDYDRRTIFDMERLHFGESFDLLPLPGNMEAQPAVTDARSSRIYTRYINYLQRDAMIQHFGFDPEESLGDDSPAYFGVVDTDEGIRTYGLHTGAVPPEIRGEWISKMLKYNRSVDFHFHAYKDVRLPAKWTQVKREAKKNAIEAVVPGYKQGTTRMYQELTPLGAKKGAPIEVRNGWWDPVGKYTPVGTGSDSGSPADISEITGLVSSPISLRGKEFENRVYGKDSRKVAASKGVRLHKGTDFDVGVGTPFFAVADGIVTVVNLGVQGNGVRWEWIDTSSGTVTKRGLVKGSVYLSDWEESVTDSGQSNVGVAHSEDFWGPQLTPRSFQPLGTFVKSKDHDTVWYYPSYTDGGQQMIVRHWDGSESKYMHIDKSLVSPGEQVEAGQRLGYTGTTASFTDTFLRDVFEQAAQNPELFQLTGSPSTFNMRKFDPESSAYPDDRAPNGDSPYSLRPHLHFEYWEAKEIPDPASIQKVRGFSSPPSAVGNVLVDPVPSWEAAKQKARPDITAVTFGNQVDETLEQAGKEGLLDPQDQAALDDLLTALNKDGWVYYEDDSSISNLWRKLLTVNVSNANGSGPDHTNDTAILANASGGLRHVVANIPILSHEYPTQQHLGSIEPTYNIEFTIRDDSTDLSGLSEKGKSLQGMRNILQSNARKFRPVADAWCVGTDTFITRLIGTYHHRDYIPADVSTLGFEGQPGFDVAKITKRSSIMRSGAGTVPGSPGVSTISLEVQETNPFDFEKLKSTALDRVDLDEARKKTLTTLFNLDFLDNVDSQTLAIIIAQQAGANVLNPDNENFGQFTVPINDTSLLESNYGGDLPTMFIEPDDGRSNQALLIRDETGFYSQVIARMGKARQDDPNSSYGPNAQYAGYTEIPLSFLGLEEEEATVNTQLDQGAIRTKAYDLSDWILSEDATTDVNNADFKKVGEYWQIVVDTLHIAERMLAENSSKGTNIQYAADTQQYYGQEGVVTDGLEDGAISEELFGLPFDAKMWRSWQEYVLAEAATQGGDPAMEAIKSTPGWLEFSGGLDSRTSREINDVVRDHRIGGLPDRPLGSILQSFDAQSLIDNTISIVAFEAALDAEIRVSNRILVNRYLQSFPLGRQLDVLLESFSYNNLFGRLLGSDEDVNTPRAFERFDEHLLNNVVGSGYFVPGFITALPDFQLNNESAAAPDYGIYSTVTELVQIAGVAAVRGPIAGKKILNRKFAGRVKEPVFKWIVNRGAEVEKVEYFKRIFARLADDIMNDQDVMAILGLGNLTDLRRKGEVVGSDAYPDIVLPYHPFFGDTISVDPDFYMWNLYEDGGALSEEIQDQVSKSVESVIQNCHNSMVQMQNGFKIDPTISKDKGIVLEPGVDGPDRLKIGVQFQAEGSDQGTFGPMSSPFYDIATAENGINTFYERLTGKRASQQEAGKKAVGASATPSGEAASHNTGPIASEKKLDSKIVGVRVANSEGYSSGNVAGGVQYPRRMTTENYRKLADQVAKVESKFSTMFGARQESGEENLLPTNSPVYNRNKGTKIDRPDEFGHSFDPASLKKLAIDSSKDIVSQRMTMRRAYPTFKLFFVEEDEFENRTLNYDDFHSYNGVQSFYSEMSRSNPADHAVITIQNVSGTLDGTKRGAVADLDYFARGIDEKIDEAASSLSGDILNRDTNLDQPIGAVVLRQGLNVQLRCGYSNDPDNLHVLLSGRIIDVHWNKNGDLAEIMVQSFGTQLVQAIKGTQRDGQGEIFYTTHQLLGSLMLEPELTHFGRWEIGQLFQIGEASDYRLDFKDYTREGFLGRFQYTKNMLQWAVDHPWFALGTVPVGTPNLLVLTAIGEGSGLFDYISENTLGAVKKFFTTQQVSLFLSPQDDNLYPPHPKDYMLLEQTSLEEFGDWAIAKASGAAGGKTGQILQTGFRWWKGNLFEKKVVPKSAQYQLVSTTIWRVFQEMSIRHPGWIYGARPYGNQFRYTMFFGVPSQRYWARGASNRFIKRANDLNQYLQKSSSIGPEQLRFEYTKLYGKDLNGKSLIEVEDETAVSAAKALKAAGIRIDADEPNSVQVETQIESPSPGSSYEVVRKETRPYQGSRLQSRAVQDIRDTAEYKAQLHQALTGPALKEYLRALNFRFVPFRRYHMFTSERNLVWNGLLSAENAVTNAVDVTYFNDDSMARDANLAPVASTMFKAHSFIPQNQLRVAPVRWPNCKGYNMAMRYGMGELLHRMRNMYRGEIIITGNARVRPWDIGILIDSYNDMVGPVEVDQVIHSFSHETGFITEIKPCAVVIGNEISSWPVMEAMQTFALAVVDIEDNYLNLRAADGESNENTDTDAGSIRDLAQFMVDWGDKDMNELLRSRHQELLGEAAKGITLAETSFGGSPVNSDVIETLIGNAEFVTRVTGPVFSAQFGSALAVAGPVLLPASIAAPGVGALAGPPAGAAAAISGAVISSKIDFPGLQWLVGGPLLFLQCLRQDSIIVVPLMKGGQPIVSGVSYHDPTMIWSNFRGDLRQYVDDILDGTRDMLAEYKQFGTYIWNNVDLYNPLFMDDEEQTNRMNLEGRPTGPAPF